MAAGGLPIAVPPVLHALGAEGVFAGSVFIGTEESRAAVSSKG